MLFSYTWLNQYLAYKVSPEELAHLLTAHAFSVDSVEKRGKDYALDIEVLPNRAADCFSHQGIAREANAILAQKGKHQKKEAEPLEGKESFDDFSSAASSDVPLRVGEKSDAPLYYLAMMDNIAVAPSPAWLCERLEAIGLDPINNLVDIANFAMLDIGQPLHIFDAATLSPPVEVRRAEQGERIELIGGQTKELTKEDIVIADATRALAIAGIKGGSASAVSNSTISIAIEAALFDPARIYRTAKRLGLATDAARRFSHGFAPEFLPLALAKTMRMVKEIAKGTGESVAREGAYAFFVSPPPLIVDKKHIEQVLGVGLKDDAVTGTLEALGFDVSKEPQEGIYKIIPPFWRCDIGIPEDIIEEVGRIYGFETIPAAPPTVLLGTPHENEAMQWRSFIRNYFIAQGFSEVYNYSIEGTLGEKEGTKVALANPMSEKRSHLRQSLLGGMLANAELNQRFFDRVAIVEIGHVFSKENDAVGEKEMIGALLFDKKDGDVFPELKGYVEDCLRAMGFDEDDYAFHQENQGLSLLVEGKAIGTLCVPTIASSFKIKGRVAFFECDLAALIQEADEEREFEEPPKFPAVERDISLYLPRHQNVGQVLNIIHEQGKELIEDVELFDMYEDASASQNSLAFHIIYRSKKKTLTDKEVNTLHAAIERELKNRLGAEVR